jgi:thiol-disulfide isomerase/thioredoxin
MRLSAFVLVLLLAALSFSPGCLEGEEGGSKEMVPTFSVVADDNTTYSSESMLGMNYIVHFSASWCNQCRPTMHAVTNHLDNEMYLVVSTDPADAPQEKLQDWHAQVNSSNDESSVQAPFSMNDKLAQEFEINNTPTLILIGKDGRVIDRHIGPLTESSEIDAFYAQADA